MKKANIYFLALLFFLVYLSPDIYSQSQNQVDLTQIVKKSEPSVVMIYSYDKEGKHIITGSGFFISRDGYILTNLHVVKDAYQIKIKVSDNNIYQVTHIVAENKESDLIILKIDAPKEVIHPLEVSNVLPEVGERIIVIGNPRGLEKTVTDGIVSAIRRDSNNNATLLQISAPVSPGSSGSPVINLKGIVVGVARGSDNNGQNLNFAVPSLLIPKKDSYKEKRFEEWSLENELVSYSVDDIYKDAIDLIKNKEYKKALIYFEKIIERDPDNIYAYAYKGYCHQMIGEYKDAVIEYKKFLKKEKGDPLVYYNLGLALFYLGNINDSIYYFKRATQLKPDFANAYYNIALAYYKLGSYSLSIDNYEKAIKLKEDFNDAYYNLGVSYYMSGIYDQAIKYFKKAIERNPGYTDAHFNLGLSFIKVNKYDKAIEALKNVIELNPDYNNAGVMLAVAYSKSGLYNESKQVLLKLIEKVPNNFELYFQLGLIYLKLEKYNEAIYSFKKVIKLSPDDAMSHFFLGLTYYKSGDKSSAINECKLLEAIDKNLSSLLSDLVK